MRKIPCCVMLSAIMLLTAACDESEPQVSVSAPALTSATTVSTADPDENAPTDATIKEVSSASFTPDGNSGKIKWLGYYDLAVDGKSAEQYKIFNSDVYGGEIEYISCASGSAYFEKMGLLIAADDSPDIVGYEWKSTVQKRADLSGRIQRMGLPAALGGKQQAAESVQNKQGVDNDIFDTVSEFAFVPYPRDPASDKYTIAYDTFGYMVAKGAKNKKGALDWINLNCVYETDETVLANKKKDYVSPEKQYFTTGKYEGSQKWTLVWDEKQYDLWQDMMDPEKFDLIFDNCWGISDSMNDICDTILFDPIFKGDSWTQLSAEYEPVIDGLIQMN